MHYWSDDDNLIVYCLYRFGDHFFGISKHELGDLLGMGFSSINLKIANFKAIDGLGGMEHYSQQTLVTSTRYKKLPDDEVRQAGIAALQRSSRGAVTTQFSSPNVPKRAASHRLEEVARRRSQQEEQERQQSVIANSKRAKGLKEVCLDNVVSAVDLETDETVRYHLAPLKVCTPSCDADYCLGPKSPLTEAFMGKFTGDVVTVSAPGGEFQHKIVRVDA